MELDSHFFHCKRSCLSAATLFDWQTLSVNALDDDGTKLADEIGPEEQRVVDLYSSLETCSRDNSAHAWHRIDIVDLELGGVVYIGLHS